MSLHTDLLRQAEHLAGLEKRKPKQASLRRAVSTAYYSLFHYLGEEASKTIAGASEADKDFRNLVRRALVHQKMKSFCSQFKPGNQPNQIVQPLAGKLNAIGNVHITRLATVFCDLQEQRHEADYDLARSITRTEALNACDQVKEAIAAWETLKRKNPEIAAFFVSTMLLWPSLSQR